MMIAILANDSKKVYQEIRWAMRRGPKVPAPITAEDGTPTFGYSAIRRVWRQHFLKVTDGTVMPFKEVVEKVHYDHFNIKAPDIINLASIPVAAEIRRSSAGKGRKGRR